MQTQVLRTNLEEAQAKLAKYQQAKGLTSVAGSMDVESARLNDLSSQLVAVQNQTFEARSRQERTGGTGDESPDLAANPMVQSLRMDIARAESKFSELSSKNNCMPKQIPNKKLFLFFINFSKSCKIFFSLNSFIA